MVSFEWKIENFECFYKDMKGKCFSPVFQEKGVDWNISLIENETYFFFGHIYSIKHSSSEEDVLQNNQSKNKMISIEIKIKESKIYQVTQKLIEMSGRHHETFFLALSKSDLLEYMSVNKTLTVIFTIYPVVEEQTSETTSKNNGGSGIYSRTGMAGIEILASNMQDLYLKGENCDFTIKVKDRNFQVHKAILSARSPVLAAMLHHDMSEKNSSATDIVDCEPEVFEKFLQYLYGGRVEELSGNNAIQLYTLGDKYDLEHLRKECVEFMKDNMCIDAFCDTISLAVRHKESTLVKCAEEFFRKNVKNILVTTKWQLLMRENPDICNELFLIFINNNV